MLDLSAVKDALSGHHVINDAEMPWAYSRANPDGRSFSDDLLPGFHWVPRTWRAYRLPLPFKQIDGDSPLAWVPIQPGYPLSPGAQVENRYLGGEMVPHVLAPYPIPPRGSGQVTRQAAWIPWQDRWLECYYADSKSHLFGLMRGFNLGLRPDITYNQSVIAAGKVGDWMTWFLEAGT